MRTLWALALRAAALGDADPQPRALAEGGPRTVTLTEAPLVTTTTTTTLPPASAYPYPYPYPKAEDTASMYLKADPTLSPDRPKNFNAIPSEAEAKVLRFGPTPPPDVGEGLEHGCVWEPGFYGCDCKEITMGCNEASQACEVALQKEEMAAPEAAKREFMASFDRTEMNALQTKRFASRLRGRQEPTDFNAYSAYMNYEPGDHEGFPVKGYPWGKTDFFSKLSKLGAEKPFPAEFGHQLFEDPPDWDNVIRGKCTLEEMKSIESCLSYFHGCYANFKQMHEWRLHTIKVTDRYLDERVTGAIYGDSTPAESPQR